MACRRSCSRRDAQAQRSALTSQTTARLAIKLTPGASADRVDGWGVDTDGRPVLKVRVRARPVEGEANEALIKLLAKTLGLPRSSVVLARGG